MEERHSWSWVIPLLIGLSILFPTIQYGSGWQPWVSALTFWAALIFSGWGLKNLVQDVGQNLLWTWKDLQEVHYRDSAAGQAASIRDLRTDQVKLMMRLTGGAWLVKMSAEEDEGPEFLLAGTEGVPIEFVKFVLDGSTEEYLYPQNRIPDQSYQFDPDFRQYSDRDYYKQLLLWLYRHEMVEWPRSNQPARFKNSWSPAKLYKRLALDGFTYDQPRPQPLALRELE